MWLYLLYLLSIMNFYNSLPEYGKELLRSIDPDRKLDRL